MGLIRLLLFLGLIYLLYRLVKKVFRTGPSLSDRKPRGVIDEMVQDPVCKAYVSKQGALRRVIGGREVFFCSTECMEAYERGHQGEGPESR